MADRLTAQVLQGAEQRQVPGCVVQRAGLRQVVDRFVVATGGIGGKGDVFGAVAQGSTGQGDQLVQRRPVVLQAARQAFLDLGIQRAHGLEPALRVAGEDDDAVLVTDIGFQAGALPALLQRFEADLDHRHADDPAIGLEPVREVVAGLADRAADAVEAPGLLSLIHI